MRELADQVRRYSIASNVHCGAPTILCMVSRRRTIEGIGSHFDGPFDLVGLSVAKPSRQDFRSGPLRRANAVKLSIGFFRLWFWEMRSENCCTFKGVCR
jgi:hypothetical protein